MLFPLRVMSYLNINPLIFSIYSLFRNGSLVNLICTYVDRLGGLSSGSDFIRYETEIIHPRK